MSRKRRRRLTGAQRDKIKKRRKKQRLALLLRAESIKKKKKESEKKDKAKKQAKERRDEPSSEKSGGKKRKISYFYLFYFTLIILFLVGLFFLLETVREKLADYEASRPYNYIDAVMEEYFKPGDAEKIIERSGYEPNVFEKREDVVSYVEGFLGGAEYYPIASVEDGEYRYAVRSGELKFAEVTMAPTGEKDRAGYDVYGMKKLDLMIAGSSAVNVSAPGGGKVLINGKVVPDSYVVDREEYPKDPHLPEEIPAEYRVTYEVTGLIGKPTVTAIDRYGGAVPDITVTDEVFYDVPYTYAFVTEEVRDRALAAGEALSAYMQKDAGFFGIAQYVDPSSDLYKDLQTSDVRWANEHNGYAIENPSVTEYVIWSDTVYSVRVKFTHVLFRWGGNFENEFDTTFYYELKDGVWLIYDSHVN